MVLEKESSILGYPGEISRPLDADHHGVCKFSSPEDPNYISIRSALLTVIRNHKLTGKGEMFALAFDDVDVKICRFTKKCKRSRH